MQPVEEKKEALGIRVLKSCRSSLYRYFPYLDGAFSAVNYRSGRVRGIGTDGVTFWFEPEELLREFGENPARVRRGYLHMLLHCLYFHMLREPGRREELWHTACDMAVEQMIRREKISELELSENLVRTECFQIMERDKLRSAEQIYDKLESGSFPYPMDVLESAFCFDNHTLWNPAMEKDGGLGLRRRWEKIRAYTGENGRGPGKRAGLGPGEEAEEVTVLPRSRFDYRRFLQRFTVPREEVELDTENFDYIFYSYGMEHYGNLPLMEPLEYKEVNRLEELVIAIDTSGSCSAETVEQFLSHTYSILNQRENFFRKMKVYLIQCDCCIQSVTVLRSEEEWREASRQITIQGRGGTDFTPVFRYIRELQEKKELRNLKALIYFTDGDGIYPSRKPEYETAFVFMKKTPAMEQVPKWALRLVAE